jgi:GxxExxY protein
VHRALGPGLLESVYRECRVLELIAANLRVECERRVSLEYLGQRIATDLKLDLLVEGCLVVELKAIERMHPVHLAQVITYLKITGYPAGLLMNFNSTSLRVGLRRLDHPDLYVKKSPAGGEQEGNFRYLSRSTRPGPTSAARTRSRSPVAIPSIEHTTIGHRMP